MAFPLLSSLRWSSAFVLTLALGAAASRAQIPDKTTTAIRNYVSQGSTDQPFTVQMVDARRTVSNTLLLRLAITNKGTAPMAVSGDFSGNDNALDASTISAVYVLDPNGRKKYEVLRTASNRPLCSRINPPIQPGERRVLYAQLAAPPDTSSSFDLYFPKAEPILTCPIGLPTAGEPIPPEASFGSTEPAAQPATPAPIAPSASITQPSNNNEPNVYTNQTNPVPNGSAGKAIGSVESNNSTVPFTVEALGLRAPVGQPAVLRLAFTNNGSGTLDATGQFIGSVTDLAGQQQITGVYLVDPATKLRYEVVRDSQTHALCSKIDPALGPGETRTLEATFPALPASVKSVYVYFPHASQITDVPVTH